MGRLIEILTELQNHSWSLSFSYLTAKFSLTIRTLQRDIKRINGLLSEISNCKIIKYQNSLILVGAEPDLAVATLLEKFRSFTNSSIKKIYQLFFAFIWGSQPLTNSKLKSLLHDTEARLQQKLAWFNWLFQTYQLNLSFQSQKKKGRILVGSEQDLQFCVANILINLHHNHPSDPDSYLDSSACHLFQQLERLFLGSNLAKSYYLELLFFLFVLIKRNKSNQELNSYHCHSQLQQLIAAEVMIQQDSDTLVNLVQEHFNVRLNSFAGKYLQAAMLLQKKQITNPMLVSFLIKIEHFIIKLVLFRYQLSVAKKKFKLLLHSFLKENYLKVLFNFQTSFNLGSEEQTSFVLNEDQLYGWTILRIINCAFQQHELNSKFHLLATNYWLLNFEKTYLRKNQKNWIIPLYYQETQSANPKLNRVVLFLKHNYPNIILQPLRIDNNVDQWHWLNQQKAIFLDDTPNLDLAQFKNLTPIKYHHLNINQQLEGRIDQTITMMMLDQVRTAILVYDCFLKQKFVSLQSLLHTLTNSLVRKFKLNGYDLDLTDAYINQQFIAKKILLVHKLMPLNNLELPIILIYLKSPLFFHKRNPIHFIFILITKTDNFYQYDWMISYLNLIKNSFDIKITSSKNLYQILNNSLSHKSLVPY